MTRPLAALGLMALTACSQSVAQDAGVTSAPPGGSYAKVADLVPLPEFIPGIGALYVDPAGLPAGPFLAYDREGGLVSTVT